MSRAFKGYASDYRADTTQQITVRRAQTRVVSVDWNAALPAGETIESVTWQCTSPWITAISDPAISGRSTTVKVNFNYWGDAFLKATIQGSGGSQQTYQFEVTVRGCPLYPSDTYSSATGPYSVTAAA